MRALVLALLASLALAPGRAAGGSNPAAAEPWPAPPARGGGGWPDAEREDFLALCRSLGPEPFCTCWLEVLEPRFRTLRAFLKEASRTSVRRTVLDHEAERCWRRHALGR